MPRLPLDGVRVIDLTWIIARPTATHFLADFGADVIKVEHEQAVHKAHTIQTPYTANVKVRTKVLDFV